MITVVTPFKRTENKDYLIKVLEGKCNWIVLQADNEPEILFPDWVKVKRFTTVNKDNISNRLFNEFLSSGLELETQYILLNDDDSIEEGFFDKIPNEDVVIVSMKRSDYEFKHVVWDDWALKRGHWEYGLDLLEAKPENMKVAKVGGEQLIIKGKIAKDFRYGLSNSSADIPGDARFVLQILNEYTPVYVPDAYVLFNYFEDGRFKSFRRKPIVLFVCDMWCAGRKTMGKSEWEGNLWASLEALNIVNVLRFHPDEYFYQTGNKSDEALLDRIKDIRPDYIVVIMYKQPGGDPTTISLPTIGSINIPIISIWGDLEAEEQQALCKALEPFMFKIIATANKSVADRFGYIYLHVPKDPRHFNNPNKERDIDIVFSGSYGYGREERQEAMLHLLNNKIKLIHGGSEGGDHFSVEEYSERYKRAKLALSFSRARGMNVVNARPFEAMNCGAMLLEQESLELAKLYTPYVDYVPWTDKDDLLKKVNYYLEHDDECKRIADNGCKKTHELYSAKTFWEKVLQ